MLEVVTVFTPRPNHAKFIDFRPLLQLQRKTALKFGHRHVIISDGHFKGFDFFTTELPQSLMLAIMVGQLNFLRAWDGEHPLVLVDVDCLVARDLTKAFDGTFDLGLTSRPDDKVAPINNGAIYIAPGNKAGVVKFFERALSLTKKHWGGDQEAISKAAAPIPPVHCVEERDGLRLAFLSMRSHNVVPAKEGACHKSGPYIVHFKGLERKPWMHTYAKLFILGLDC
jgi:hypothetical protein